MKRIDEEQSRATLWTDGGKHISRYVRDSLGHDLERCTPRFGKRQSLQLRECGLERQSTTELIHFSKIFVFCKETKNKIKMTWFLKKKKKKVGPGKLQAQDCNLRKESPGTAFWKWLRVNDSLGTISPSACISKSVPRNKFNLWRTLSSCYVLTASFPYCSEICHSKSQVSNDFNVRDLKLNK